MISANEKKVLRALARRVAEIAALPEMEDKRRAVIALNRLDPVPPRIYCFPEGAWLECIPPGSLLCNDELLRSWEFRLRMAIYTHEFFNDDQPIDAVFNVPWQAGFTGCGLEPVIVSADTAQRHIYYVHPYSNLGLSSHSGLGAVHYEPPIKERSDIEKITTPHLIFDRDTSMRLLDTAHELFDGVLEVRRRSHYWQTVGGVCATAVRLRGMDVLMIDMLDAPDWIQEYLGKLAANQHAMLDQLEAEGLLSLNNGCEWIHTGGIGYTDKLPQHDFDPARVRCTDIWGGCQSQDLIGISPNMFEELFFPHVQPVAERFGLASYGCCEPLHDWIPILRRIRNLRRVSISAWADVAKSAEQLSNGYVFSYKPLPTPLTTETVDEDAIRKQMVASFTLTHRHDCRVEVMMKDLHTVRHQPGRLRRWVELVRHSRDKVYG